MAKATKGKRPMTKGELAAHFANKFDLTRAHALAVKSGVPGVAYVRFDPKVEWPARLQPKS